MEKRTAKEYEKKLCDIIDTLRKTSEHSIQRRDDPGDRTTNRQWWDGVAYGYDRAVEAVVRIFPELDEHNKVLSWFDLDEERENSLESIVKYNIAMTVEGWLNGARDDNYEPKTVDEMINYTYAVLQDEMSRRHLHFHGKKTTMDLIRKFVTEYKDLQLYIKR
jgi:hypothetical protein